MRFFSILLTTCLLYFVFTPKLFAKIPTITVWNYYLAPPFITSPTQGLAYDFVNLLNVKLKGKYQFKLKSIPRSRLDIFLKEEKQGIVLFVNWIWMGKGAKEKYLWTPTVFLDQNEVISLKSRKIIYDTPESLKGLKFGAVSGRKYNGFSSLFSTNEVERFDVTRDRQVLEMMIRDRIDVTIQPRSLATAIIKKMGLKDKFYFSPKPHFTSTKHIMITSKLQKLHLYLNQMIDTLKDDKKWNIIVNKYELIEEDIQ